QRGRRTGEIRAPLIHADRGKGRDRRKRARSEWIGAHGRRSGRGARAHDHREPRTGSVAPAARVAYARASAPRRWRDMGTRDVGRDHVGNDQLGNRSLGVRELGDRHLGGCRMGKGKAVVATRAYVLLVALIGLVWVAE